MRRRRGESVDAVVASAVLADEIVDLRAQVSRLASGTNGHKPTPPEDEKLTACTYCGVGAWGIADTATPTCELCQRDMPLDALTDEVRDAWRHKLTQRALGQPPCNGLDQRRAGVLFWDELPPSKRVPGDRRWQHIDVARVVRANRLAVAKLRAGANVRESVHRAGSPCEVCGCAYLWRTVPEASTQVRITQATGPDDYDSHFEERVVPQHLVCDGCSD